MTYKFMPNVLLKRRTLDHIKKKTIKRLGKVLKIIEIFSLNTLCYIDEPKEVVVSGFKT